MTVPYPVPAMGRARTTKTLAKRIQLDYFRRAHPFRTWKSRLSWTVVAIGAAGIGLALLPARRLAWSGGPLTSSHAFFHDRCAACHRTSGTIPDAACAECHAGPPHHENQVSTPACASCHAEHRGLRLTAVPDSHCAACHAALATRTGRPEVAARIRSFASDHPEFAAIALGRDPGRLRLNHRLHLQPGLEGPEGPVTLGCGSCHQPDEIGTRMRAVSYERHCGSCHRLGFDTEGRFPPGTVVPHGDPEAARAFLIELYAGTVVEKPAATGEADPVASALARRRARKARLEAPASVPLSAPAGTERAFVTERAVLALRVLERQTCAYCHGRSESAGGEGVASPAAGFVPSSRVPDLRVPPPNVPLVWLPRARFAHRAHRALACVACHDAAPTSEKTSDVLLPARSSCVTCHHDGGAPTGCVTCHHYHSAEGNPLGPGRLSLPHAGGMGEDAPEEVTSHVSS